MKQSIWEVNWNIHQELGVLRCAKTRTLATQLADLIWSGKHDTSTVKEATIEFAASRQWVIDSLRSCSPNEVYELATHVFGSIVSVLLVGRNVGIDDTDHLS